MRKKKIAEEPKPTPFEIGRTGTVEQFGAANDAAIARQSKGKHLKSKGVFWFEPTFPEYLGTEDQNNLWDGAVQALHEDRPENIQAILLDPGKFAIRGGSVSGNIHSESFVRLVLLRQLIKESSDPAADIRLALAAFEPEGKQHILDSVLHEASKVAPFPGTAFIAAILDAGANGNAQNGYVFANAIYYDLPEDTIQLLYKKGASFRDALSIMEKDSDVWKQKTITRLNMYRKKFTGESGDELSAVKKELAELKESFNTLSQKLAALFPPAASSASPPVGPASEPKKLTRRPRQP